MESTKPMTAGEVGDADSVSEQTTQNILDTGSSIVRSNGASVFVESIVGQIEGHTLAGPNTKTTKYEHMLPLLAKLEASEDIDGVLFLLNTVGGDVEAGLAIAS